MKSLSGQELRRLYKQFFEERGHSVFSSASLVPKDDPTLLWINAGMAPLKPYFDGREIPENPRIVSSQKCIRTNDIENVGHTARHQTFFEMLGNFSFGDYFKKDAIAWAWEFLTKYLEMDSQRLFVTIHVSDDEAFHHWHDDVGVPAEHIYRGEEDNFWEIGEGPCGPCSEVFYDRGEKYGCGESTCQPGCDCDRYLEIWNLVFTQYNKDASGEYTPLPKKNIDTGMGLERVASVLQDVDTNFETDLFLPLIRETQKLTGQEFTSEDGKDVHFKIIADHVRTVAFAIGDGVLPGNEGRHYIIRRLLRRAVRSGRKLGLNEPFLYKLADVVSELMGADYPDVREKLSFITKVIRTEEERFHETLEEGENLLTKWLKEVRNSGKGRLEGKDAFQLYDTFGFPLDITEEMAREQGIEVDRAGFEAELEAQRSRARNARVTTEGMNTDRGVLESFTDESRFVGYTTLNTESVVTALVQNGEFCESVSPGDEAYVILDTTPFYAESGGQVADAGVMEADGLRVVVLDVQKAPHGQNLHRVKVETGTLSSASRVTASVDASARRGTVKNHTATHLLHKGLREVLGTHVTQAGSLVTPNRLRFDFSHFGTLSKEELADVELRVNQAVWRDDEVETLETDLETAKELGAMALFGEKYGSRVRVVKAGDYSMELCGGCHVARTGLIGQFRIVSETGIGSGVRRIEAVTGEGAYRYALEQQQVMNDAAELLKTTRPELVARIERLLDEHKQLDREVASLKAQLNRNLATDLRNQVQDVSGIPVLTAIVPDTDMDELRQLVDELKSAMPSYVIVLGSGGDKVKLVAAVSKDLHAKGLHAGNIVKQVAAVTGGGGGGRPDLAQAGGKDESKLPEAVELVPSLVQQAAVV
ncbi:alanine--tRNA ligase [Alicyclobacillus sp. SO9]|uniref:alanine--tRNA ligase n=1 Tax=Alicyclobacillus sp. SO9 TaxID=2665646 RepID=UPI0018E7F074|nr:alanine--tRNA ligase [Alicyclobacillus sp. SO9]QQE77368.1 alanine--tRNA ligase [Alicyclobacillus sp. SO9]